MSAIRISPLRIPFRRSYSTLNRLSLPSMLKDPTLFRTDSFVNGSWRPGGDKYPVIDPATNLPFAEVVNSTKQDAEDSIRYASDAFKTWKTTTARKEVVEIRRVGRRILVLKQPIGVCALITPWNFPLAMLTRKIAPALCVGNTCVIKPAPETPLSALALVELGRRAGVPEGVVGVVTCSRERTVEDVGKALVESEVVRKVSFTGSTATGKLLMAQSASTLKKVSFELGGNAPFIVFDSADIDAAVDGCIASKFRNAGQTCVSVNRIYVQSAVHDEFVDKLVGKVKALRVGSGFDPTTQIGPLINPAAIKKAQAHIANALSHGAQLLCGSSEAVASQGNFWTPTVLAGMKDGMDVSCQETFGPVAAVFKFDSEEEVLHRANDTEHGLAGYIYTQSLPQIFRVSEALEVGMVGVNESIISTEVAPFGGVKSSGLGREGSVYGVDDYVEMKYVCLGGI
ncbi:hypothetical protein HDV05_001185 [Chytridiales sp. JEL 0842]|nr:hypothetical protein HDV05_001185 [Chytridiales sp. JEL 0842]